jgi:hypothetical protein
MPGKIEFTYNMDQDVVIAKPKWTIALIEDCDLWYTEWTEYLSKFGKKVDTIILLDEFIVDSKIAPIWGEYRARLTKGFMRFSYRVKSRLATDIYIKTSGVRFNASSKVAKSVESAIEAIMLDRKNLSTE